MAFRSLLPFSSTGVPAERATDPFLQLHREMNRLFDDVFRGTGWRGGGNWGEAAAPQMDVSETDREIKIRAELPGVDEKDVEVILDEDVLTIRGEKKLERDEKEENFHIIERSEGSFVRSVRLPYAVDLDKVQASFRNGVLTVTLPKPAERQQRTRRIEVQSGSGAANVNVGAERAAAGSKPGSAETASGATGGKAENPTD